MGSLAALYAASRGQNVEIYELRSGQFMVPALLATPANCWLVTSDLRDPSTMPLNFTRSINLALSERGINAMRHAGQPKLIEHVMAATIPMRGRMIHGKHPNDELYEESQDYDARGRVCPILTEL